MKKKRLPIRLVVLLAAMICALGAAAAEAYANYTPSNKTLTFYYDNLRSSRTGTTYNLNTGSSNPGWYTDGTNANVTKVVFNSSFAGARPTTTYAWFCEMGNLESITGMSYLNTSEVTDMGYMFLSCHKLTSLDMSHFNTSKVTDMFAMFDYCDGLTGLDLSSFNTSKVTNMAYMFFHCYNLRTIYVGNGWSTAAVTTSASMFNDCNNLVGGKGTTYNDSNPVDKTYAHIDGGPSNPGYFTDKNEAYACYTPSNTTLTFYYDNQRNSRTGRTYNLNTGFSNPGWYTDSTNANVTKVVFNSSFAGARPTTTFAWFCEMGNLESITGMSYLNTSEVTDMGYMFLSCHKLTSLDMSHFNTSKVTDMFAMFDYCDGLTGLDLSSFNTSKVTNMAYMFFHCYNLRTIYVGNGWSTAAVTTSASMFNDCNNLVGGKGTTYNDSNPVDKTYAHIDGGPSNPGYFTDKNEAYACYTPSNTTLTFYYDDQRSSRTGTTYNLNTGSNQPSWRGDGTAANVTKVVFNSSFAGARPTTTYDWFSYMQNLQSITGLSYLNTSEVTNMAYMFMRCSKLTSLDVSHFNTAKVTNMQSMFNNCSSLTSLDLSSFNTSKVTVMTYMFRGCSNLRTIYVNSDWSTAAVTNSTEMFLNSTNLVGGQGTAYDASHIDKAYAHIDGGPNYPGYLTVTGTGPYACYTPSNTTLTFYYDNQRSSRTGTTYDLNTGENDVGWKTDGTNANVTKVVFDPSFAIARPTTTYSWFYLMKNLLTINDIEYLNTSEVTNMAHMFNSCSKLTSIDLSGFNTSKVTEMRVMFCNCTGLTGLDLSSFNTSNVTNMFNIFGGCSGLTSLDLSSFNTSNVTNMFNIFGGCSGLTSLDLSSFNTSNVTDMGRMFYECSRLTTVYVGEDWSTEAVTSSSYMFHNNNNLVGSQGTTYNGSNPKDKTYAHIDGGTSNPGYFTATGTQAYACYTPSNTTLTFYYDNQRSSRAGTTYNLNTSSNQPSWKTDGTNANVTRVVFDPSFAGARPTTTYMWFYLMKNLESITGLNYLKTDEVTNMAHMFNSCSKLTSLDLSSFNTSKVTDMQIMFYNCTGLTSIDMGSFYTANVTNMFNMFGGCSSLRTVYVDGGSWWTGAVTNSSLMFSGCTSLLGGQGTTYDASHIDKAYAHIDGGTSNPGYFTATGTQAYAVYTPENTTLTFYYDNQRSTRTGTAYDLNTGDSNTDWDTDGTRTNVTRVVFDPSFASARPTTTYDWLYGMQNLQAIEGIEYLNTSEVTNMDHMFNGCSSVTSLDVSHFNTSKVTVMRNMFSDCSSLTSLDLSSFNTSNVTSMYALFENCGNLRTVYVGNDWNTAAVTNSNYMFDGCFNLVGGKGTTYNESNPKDKTYAHIDGGASDPGYFTAAGTKAYTVYSPENTTLTFYYDTERDSRPGTTYDLNTGNNDPDWETDSTNTSVTRVVFDPSFANARPTTTDSWFYNMQNLQTIEGMEYLNTSEVTNMTWMFGYCPGLTSLDLSHFNTSKVTNMTRVFAYSSGLTSLDLSSFSTSQVTNMTGMFRRCGNLRTITVGSDWSTAAVVYSQNMFGDDTCLVGGKGTTYDASHIDKAYAHIDGGASNPGYFTAAGTEAYACYTPENTTLTFYYDTERGSRPGTTYNLNTGMNTPAWRAAGANVTQVVCDPSFAVARPTTTYLWFYGMQNLQTIEGMEYLNTTEVTDIAYMFGWCTSLTSLDLSHFNTSKVTNMGFMFYNCESLTSLDLSSFNTSMVTNTGFMFYGCSNLRTIYASEGWSTEAVTNSIQMFNYATSLVGGQGTTYDASHIDKAYAHIDGGPNNPGYLSEKASFTRGDVNGDGQVKIGDVTALINYLLSHDATGINLDAADTNQNGGINISDVTFLINYLLSGSW